MDTDKIFKVIASILIIGALLLFVLPGIFWAAVGIIFQLFIIIVWGIIGYIMIKALESIWKKKGGK